MRNIKVKGYNIFVISHVLQKNKGSGVHRTIKLLYLCLAKTINLLNTETMGKFVVSLRKNGEFQFNLKATNGQVILTSEGYTTKAACLNGIESVRKNGPIEDRYEVKVAKNGKPFFNLKASNGQVVGSSQMYASERTMKQGIASVMRNAPESPVVEELD